MKKLLLGIAGINLNLGRSKWIGLVERSMKNERINLSL